MRITCPLCGERDRREFYYYGDAVYADRPAADAAPEAWDDYLHLRDNPAGETRDLWYHEMGCAAWIEVTRNTVTHEILATRLVAGREGKKTAAKGRGASPCTTATVQWRASQGIKASSRASGHNSSEIMPTIMAMPPQIMT